jgi:hypothetical protein
MVGHDEGKLFPGRNLPIVEQDLLIGASHLKLQKDQARAIFHSPYRNPLRLIH